jgi:hypothetical protein
MYVCRFNLCVFEVEWNLLGEQVDCVGFAYTLRALYVHTSITSQSYTIRVCYIAQLHRIVHNMDTSETNLIPSEKGEVA